MTNWEFSHKLDVMWDFLEAATSKMENDGKALKIVQQIQTKILALDKVILRHEPGAKTRANKRQRDCS